MSRTAESTAATTRKGIAVQRRFTSPGVHPFDEVEWEIRDAIIGDPENPAFEQRGVEFPKTWSQNATNIVAQKYFRGKLGTPERESSVKQMIGRVAGTISGWGREGGYFATAEDADAFEVELTSILLNQKAAFNSPGVVQRRLRGDAAVLGLLHPQRRGHDGVDPRLEHQGGDDLPRWLGIGDQPLQHPRLDRAPLQGRPRLGPGQLHARRRRVGRDDQVRRQDPARGEDGRPRRRPPRHRGLHLVQGARGGEGRAPCATPASTCRSTARASPRSSTRTPTTRSASPTSSCRRSADGDDWDLIARNGGGTIEDPRRSRADEPDRRRGLALRRPGRPVRHDDQPLAHLPGVGPDQRLEPLLPGRRPRPHHTRPAADSESSTSAPAPARNSGSTPIAPRRPCRARASRQPPRSQ